MANDATRCPPTTNHHEGQSFLYGDTRSRTQHEYSVRRHQRLHQHAQLCEFTLATTADIRRIVLQSSAKSCDLDPMPTSLLKGNIDLLAPILTDIINTSLAAGVVPVDTKRALVTPILKKRGLDIAHVLKSDFTNCNVKYIVAQVRQTVMAEGLVQVPAALANYRQGSCNEYDKFLSQLSDPDIPNSTLVTYLRSLKDCAMLLGKEHEVLVGVMLKLNWSSRGGGVVREYKAFILNLVSSHTFYLRACLRMIITQFRPKLVRAKGEAVAMVTEERRKEDEEVFVHLHTLLKAIIHTVPMTPTVLLPLLIEYFPYMLLESYLQECYVKNVLQISYYLLSERCKLLELIVDRMTRLDVRSPRQDIQDAEADSEDEQREEDEMEQDVIFDMDEMDVSSVMGQGVTTVSAPKPMTHKEADRLDVMIELVFRYTYNVCHNKNGELEWEATKKLYRELLLVFDCIILPTHASCHVQFIVFYISSFHKALAEGFLDYLWKKLQNPNTQVVFRQAAVAYIASFLARAKHVNISTVRVCLDLMAAWAHRYITEASYTSSSNNDMSHHATFYSVCQAIFYVVTFRHKELLSTKQGYKHCQRLNLQTIVTARLNPLRMCLAIIAKTFASITRMHQLAFCDTILERNRRTMFPTSADGAGVSVSNPLDAFFPFDPYLLNRSGRYVVPLYREYDGVLAQVTQDESNSEDEEEPYTDGGQHKTSETFPYNKAFSPAVDLFMFGTSPGFKNI
ncbi:RNA polymerase I-specific transcription initiation factor RRN3 [Lamellibrachia satsuma]|nr:RNA polymerase I-specific transcription initiation factor RRN3 [Lamellibrachia satsuma]